MIPMLRHPNVRRAAFVGGNLALCAIIVIGLIIPAHDFFYERDARIAERRNVLARLTAMANQAEQVSSAAQQAAGQRGEFLVGPNDGVINADLQTRLKGMAEGVGARVRSLQTLPAANYGQSRYSGSRIEFFGPLQSIHSAVNAIESAKPYLFITAASIKLSPPTVGGGPGVVAAPVVQAQLDVFGAVQIAEHRPK